MGDMWYLDELFVTIQGRRQYLWRAVDEDGDVIDILVQSRRDRHAATRFFRKLLKRQRSVPRRLITDKLRSYASARRAVLALSREFGLSPASEQDLGRPPSVPEDDENDPFAASSNYGS